MRIAIALLMASTAFSAQAATYTLTPVLTQAFDSGFSPIAFDPLNPTEAVLQFDILLEVADLPADNVFGNIAFDLGLDNLVPNAAASTWNPNNPTVDINGPVPGGENPTYGTNADLGLSPTDLEFITVSLVGGISNASDPRRGIGEGGAALLGSVFVDYTSGFSTFSVEGIQASTADGAGTLVLDSAAVINGGSVVIGIPEPTTVALAGLGLVGVVARRRR